MLTKGSFVGALASGTGVTTDAVVGLGPVARCPAQPKLWAWLSNPSFLASGCMHDVSV